MAIQSFRCAETESLYQGRRIVRWANIERAAIRKLTQLAVSSRLEDLRIPPGNRLELLRGDRQGQYSIRINDQWRVCFVWTNEGAHHVEIVDYH
jgi:proteic killer suppression protein